MRKVILHSPPRRAEVLARMSSRSEEDNRFANAVPSLHPVTRENLDIPTWLRKGLKVREAS